MPKSRTHRVTLHVAFDRVCTKAEATAAVRDCIHGTFYTAAFFDDKSPNLFTVRAVTRAPAAKKGTKR